MKVSDVKVHALQRAMFCLRRVYMLPARRLNTAEALRQSCTLGEARDGGDEVQVEEVDKDQEETSPAAATGRPQGRGGVSKGVSYHLNSTRDECAKGRALSPYWCQYLRQTVEGRGSPDKRHGLCAH